MHRPNPEVVAEAQQRELENKTSWEHLDDNFSVEEFLSFAGRVATGPSGGRGLTGPRQEVWNRNSHSKILPLETEAGSPQMGASVGANFIEVSYRSWFKKRVLAREVVSATVSIGPIAEDDGFPEHLAAADEVIRVFAHPPTILHTSGEGPLAVVDRDSEEYARVKELIGTLYGGEKQIADKQALPTGHEVNGK